MASWGAASSVPDEHRHGGKAERSSIGRKRDSRPQRRAGLRPAPTEKPAWREAIALRLYEERSFVTALLTMTGEIPNRETGVQKERGVDTVPR